MLDTISKPWVFSVGTVEDGLFDYDLGFGEQQLIPNSQIITNNSQTPRDFSKQTPLNPTPVSAWMLLKISLWRVMNITIWIMI